jgi:hypothetical protein
LGFFETKVSLCSSCWPQTCDPPASASRVSTGITNVHYHSWLCLTTWGNAKLFSTAGTPSYIPTDNVGDPHFSTSLPTVNIYTDGTGVKWYLGAFWLVSV